MHGLGQALGGVRTFTTSVVEYARAYKSVVNRQLKKRPEYKVGDVRPNKLWIPKELSAYPAYPYGEARIFKRSDRGLYGGQVIATGNKVSEMGNKSRRTWLPNVIVKSVWSQALNRMIRMRMTARVLRTITKEGGLDNYVTKDKEARIKELGLFGWELRHDILKARLEASKPANYQVAEIKGEDGTIKEVKVFYKGMYAGEEIQLTRGKRALLRHMFPVVKLHTAGELTYGAFNVARATQSYEQLLRECETLAVDLSPLRV